jgi:hypothetical protein
MSPRIVACLMVSIVAGVASFAWALFAGWGFLLALLAYSFGGSLTLVLATATAAALDDLRQAAGRSSRPQRPFGRATAHSG